MLKKTTFMKQEGGEGGMKNGMRKRVKLKE